MDHYIKKPETISGRIRQVLNKNRLIKRTLDDYFKYSRPVRLTLIFLIFLVVMSLGFAAQILVEGLGYTDMNNYYPFGLWIIGDLVLVSLGGGAFTTGFMLYLVKHKQLEPIMHSTVLLGFLCYLFTFVFLVFDIGQPLRAWFGYAYPNWGENIMPQSMLTEVIWCLTFYFIILCVEFLPVTLKHRVLARVPLLNYTRHALHKIMWIFAAAGTFLSFFHQGSLGGGMWDSMYAKAVWFRPYHIYFFVVIIGAMAGGTSFMALCAYIAGKVRKQEVVPAETFHAVARISGIMMIVFFIARLADVILMGSRWVPLFDREYMDLQGGYYGLWLLILEFVMAFITIIMLAIKRNREREEFFLIGTITGVTTMVLEKFIVVLNGSSVPKFPWKKFISYNPTFQEWAIMLGGLSCMILIYMWCSKYLPLFPHAEEPRVHDDLK